MNILDAIILGLVQGLTEFIPVSSSGHLVLTQHFLGLHPPAVFDSLINLGTFLALVIYFRKRLWDIGMQIIKLRDFRLARNIIISAIPVGAAGILFKGFFQSEFVQSAWVVAVMLFSLGVIMLAVDRLPKASAAQAADNLSPKRAGFIGMAQILALIPGTSRSGATIIVGRLAGLTYKQAAEYSFLLSIPVMLGVVLLGFLGGEERLYIQENFMVWLVSNIAAFVSGLIAVGFMLRYLAKGNLTGFGIYRIILATVVVATLVI